MYYMTSRELYKYCVLLLYWCTQSTLMNNIIYILKSATMHNRSRSVCMYKVVIIQIKKVITDSMVQYN